MKNNYEKINILIFTTIFITLAAMGLFNFIVDPYGYFHRTTNTEDTHCRKNLVYLNMKRDKNSYETVFLGSSEIYSLFSLFLDKPSINFIWNNLLNTKDYYNMIKNYLSMHPETKRIVIVISYQGLLQDCKIPLPEFNAKHFTPQEIQTTLFSLETTSISLRFVKNFITQTKNEEENDAKKIEVYPFWISNSNADKDDINKSIYYMEKIIELLKEKNIDYKIVIPPYSAIFLSILNTDEDYKNNIEAFKKQICEKNVTIYDFGFVNKYTSENLTKDSTLYYAPDHPDYIWGAKVYKVLYDEKNAEKDICLLLNKNNVLSMLKTENNLLEKYRNDNKELIVLYDKYKNNLFPTEDMKRTINEIPEIHKKELDYTDNFMKEE